MTTANSVTTSRPVNIGRGLLLLAGVLLVLNGAWLFFGAAAPAVFESDTGVSLADLRATYPNVATELLMRGRVISLLQVGFGLLLLVADLPRGSKLGPAGATLVTTVALTWLFVASGRAEIGSYYLMYVLLSAAALVLVTRR